MPHLGQARPLVVWRPARHLLLLGDLVLDLGLLVQLVEGVHDDGDGERDDQHPADGAGGAAQLPEPGARRDVAVAYGGHRDDGPVQRRRHRDELVRVGVLLHHEGEAREDEHAHDHDEAQQAELLVRVLQRGAESLESGDVATQPEYPQDPHDAEDLGHPPHLVLVLARALHVGQGEGHEVGHDAEQVDHVHALLDEVPLLGRGNEADPVLYREPGDEDGLGYCKITMLICFVCLRIRNLKHEMFLILCQLQQ